MSVYSCRTLHSRVLLLFLFPYGMDGVDDLAHYAPTGAASFRATAKSMNFLSGVKYLMRSHLYTEIDMLVRDAKRLPKVAALVERAHLLTDEEIDTADVPLAWYKKALRKLRDKCNKEAIEAQEYQDIYARVAGNIRDTKSPDPSGQMREWLGGEAWIDVGETKLLIDNGKLIWFPMSSGGCWIETLFIDRIDPRLISQTRPGPLVSKSEYTEMYKEALARRLGKPLYSWEADEVTAQSSNLYRPYRLDDRDDGINVRDRR